MGDDPQGRRSAGDPGGEAVRYMTPPPFPSRSECPRCLELRAKDWANRFPVGHCGPDCLGKTRWVLVRGKWEAA